MDIITIDFETYYDKEFSLSKLTTEEYVRDPRFEIIGVGIKINDEKTRFFSGEQELIREQLSRYDWGNSLVVAHNAMFDMAILNWVLGIRPKMIADTLSMARALHGTEVGNSLAKLVTHYGLGEKGTEVVNALGKRRADFDRFQMKAYAMYCINDVDLTYELFMTFMPSFNKVELRLIDITIKMFTQPALRLDERILEQHLVHVKNRKKKLLDDCGADIDDLMSNAKFATLLRNLGIEPPTKISPTTGKIALALAKNDEEFKALADHPDERVQTLVSARLGNKTTLEETRTERLIGIAKRGLVPVPLSYYAAHTGRWGGADKLNFQNLPSRGENAGKIKKAILAPEGYVIIDCDSAQIEARVLAWFAGQDDLVQAFANGEDVYKIMAASIYKKPVEEVLDTKANPERFVGKTTILGSGYGMGGIKFQTQLKTFGTDIPLEEATRIIKVYRETYPKIPELWNQGNNALDAMTKGRTAKWGNGAVVIGKEGILMPNGLYQRYPNLKKVKDKTGKQQYIYDSRKGAVKLYGGKLTENICQGLARCIIGEQMIKISRKYRVVLTVHDAVACIAPKEEAQEAMAYVMECMRYIPEWAQGIPLNCEAGYGESYGDC
jgi:DNA polymerase